MLAIIKNEVTSFFRNGSSLFFCIFFPSILVLLLGTFLENVVVADYPVGELKIAYSVESADKTALVPFEEFLRGLESENVLTAEKKISSELESAITDGYSAAVELNGTDITIYNGGDSIKNRTVKALFDSYTQTASTMATVAAVNPMVLAEAAFPSDESYVSQKDLGVSRTMMDYYAVAMMVMIIFMAGCISGGSTYYEETKHSTLNRLEIAPVSKTAIYFGKIIGNLPMVLIQVLTVMTVSTVFYGAHYCADVKGNILLAAMFICSALAIVAFGIIIGLFLPKTNPTIVLMPVLWCSMFVSGTFANNIYIKGLTDIMPMYKIQQAAFDLTVFSRPEKAVHVIIVSLILLVLFIAIGAIKVNIRRKNA